MLIAIDSFQWEQEVGRNVFDGQKIILNCLGGPYWVFDS